VHTSFHCALHWLNVDVNFFFNIPFLPKNVQTPLFQTCFGTGCAMCGGKYFQNLYLEFYFLLILDLALLTVTILIDLFKKLFVFIVHHASAKLGISFSPPIIN